jgi:hypothetical protein
LQGWQASDEVQTASTGSFFSVEQALGAKAMQRIVEHRATLSAAKSGPLRRRFSPRMADELLRRCSALRAAAPAAAS